MSIDVHTIGEKFFVGVRRTAPASGIGAACADVLPRTAGMLAQRGIAMASRPATLYHAEKDGIFELQPGFFVEGACEAEAPFEFVHIPAGEVATTVYRGPYEGLAQVHDALLAFVRERGRTRRWPVWEVYLNDPGNAAPQDYETEVTCPFE